MKLYLQGRMAGKPLDRGVSRGWGTWSASAESARGDPCAASAPCTCIHTLKPPPTDTRTHTRTHTHTHECQEVRNNCQPMHSDPGKKHKPIQAAH